MPSDMNKKWWVPAVGWSVAGLAVFLLAATVIPDMAENGSHPFLAALARHTLYLYWASGLMVIVGVLDSAFLYRRQRFRRK
jgi:hypothetical protein